MLNKTFNGTYIQDLSVTRTAVSPKKESINANKEDEKENKRLNNNNNIEDNEGEKKEGGFKVTILEGNIGEEIIDTSSKLLKQNEEGGLEDLD